MNRMKKLLRPPAIFIILAALVLGIALAASQTPTTKSASLTLGELESKITTGQVASAKLADRDHTVSGRLADNTRYHSSYPGDYGSTLTTKLLATGARVEADAQRQSFWSTVLLTFLPTLLILGVLIWFISKAPGGRGAMQLGKSKARRWKPDGPAVTFADVAGIDEAVGELAEIKDFLREPARFANVGARVPKGVLLYGPPGTGKTLLARAVAGEAGVPFFSIAGSDFVEMFVGVGASRVRDLFAQAKAEAPAIIFVDEIDAVGRHRGQGLTGANDEREQTLNQLLVEMDGFDAKTGVILIAGTNRPDILDQALLRPGRFDRQVAVDLPDLQGRKAILAVHAKGKPMEPGIDISVLARRTPGFTGADLANVLNEAAILAARRHSLSISSADVESAIDRVMAGPEKKNRIMSARDKKVIAYHEAGHALVGHVLPNTDPIHKVSIIGRGRALGWTLALPDTDRLLQTRSQLLDELAMLLAGRCSEELVFGEPTTGAQNDIERATMIARMMVTQFGMSERMGLLQIGSPNADPLAPRDYSERLASEVDAEVRRILSEANVRAEGVLTTNRVTLDRLADALVEHETLGESELAVIFEGFVAEAV